MLSRVDDTLSRKDFLKLGPHPRGLRREGIRNNGQGADIGV